MRLLETGRWVALAAVAIALVIIPANTTDAASKKVARALETSAFEQFGDNDGPAFLLVSISSPNFEFPIIDHFNGSVINQADELGSTLAWVQTGHVIAGFDVATTRFEGDPSVPTPDLGGAFIDGHAATFIGGFRTHGDGMIHVMTPSPDAENHFPPDVQEALFYASRKFQDPTYGLPDFPTTVQLASFIVQFGGPDGGSADVDINAVMMSLFVGPPPPPSDPPQDPPETNGDLTMDCGSPCLAEGELYGHQPTGALLFFRGLFDDDNDTLKLDIGRNITFDIKPGNANNPLNLGSEGVVPTGIFSEEVTDPNGTERVVFNAVAEIDVTTIRAIVFDIYGFELASIPVDKTSVTDLNDDGVDDLMVHFRTQLLVSLIDFEQTVTINFRANTQAEGMELSGSDNILVVPKK